MVLQQLMAEIREELQLVWDRYEEMRQPWISIDTAIQEKCRVLQELLTTISTLAASATEPQAASASGSPLASPCLHHQGQDLTGSILPGW